MVIGICDDHEMIIRQLKRIIDDLLMKQKVNYSIRTYLSGTELLKDINQIDVVFLDIDMPGMDGIEVGKQIVNKSDCKIIMETSRVDRFKEAFKIHAIRFVTKPFDPKEIDEALKLVMKGEIGVETIELYSMRNPYNVKQNDICYIRAFNGYVECMVGDKIFRKDISLNKLEEMLDKRLFARVNRQYIVNIRWVSEYYDGDFTIWNQKFQVSRRLKKDFEKKYMEFDLNYRWDLA